MKYCSKCGAENQDEHKFCEACGEELNIEKKRPVLDDDKKRKIAVIAGAIAIVACIIVVVVMFSGKASPEYNEAIEKAGKYLNEMDYDKAETAYLEAIEIEPKQEEAYIKLADTYVAQKKYTAAVEILEQGDEAARGKEIEKKLAEVGAYSSYYEFLENSVIPEIGLAETVDKHHWSNSGGLISAYFKDITGDDTPEMITISFGSAEYSEITISTYSYSDGNVTQIDEYIEDSFGDDYLFAAEYNVCIRTDGEKYYLVIIGEQIYHMEGGGDAMYIYSLDNGKVGLETWIIMGMGFGFATYTIEDEVVAEYIQDDMRYFDQGQVMDANHEGFEVIRNELEKYGMTDKIYTDDYGYECIEYYDPENEAEELITTIYRGTNTEYSGVVFEDKELRSFIDYTNLRDYIN